MRALIDTNILIDFLSSREPFYSDANDVIQLCADKKINGFMAAHSVSNLFYIMRNDMNVRERKDALLKLCKILTVEGIDAVKVISGLQDDDFNDFEDRLQYECATAVGADYIVTRNPSDFERGTIPCVNAGEMKEIIYHI